jgi:3-oxoacid CoA-transferase subunit B
MVPGKLVKGAGAAMDLVHGAARVIMLVEHRDRQGNSKIIEECTLTLTGARVAQRIVTGLAVIDVADEGTLTPVEPAPRVSVEFVRSATSAALALDDALLDA